MINENDLTLLLLSGEEISIKKTEMLIKLFDGEIINLQKEIFNGNEQVLKILGNADVLKIKTAYETNKISTMLSALENNGVGFLTILNKDYPFRLKEIDSAPYVIYFKGDSSILNSELIAIVGSRKPNAYGKEMTDKFASALAKENFVIVSGLAYGVDTIAHTAAVRAKQKTVAVLACGLNKIYPAENENLAREIVEMGGCLVSEYFLGTNPDSFRFPARNRIISGLSMGTLVTQATEKSGSLITANYTIEQNRDLFVIPANLNLFDSKGTNSLIVSIPDCVTMSPEKIILSYRECVGMQRQTTQDRQLGMEETAICEFLKSGEKSFDEILEATALNPKILNQKLTSLEIGGIIERISGNYYSIIMENLWN